MYGYQNVFKFKLIQNLHETESHTKLLNLAIL